MWPALTLIQPIISPPDVENSPATARDIANPQIDPASNALAADVVTEAPTVAVDTPYTPEQVAVIEEIAEEASSMFCVGATCQSSGELRDAVRKFAHKKGFSVTSFGNRFSCSRCAEAPCYRAKRLKKQQQTAPEKRRKRNTTRVGCSFQVSYTHLNRREKRADQPIRINASTCYRHSNGCFPSSSQLSIEKRKAGAVTAAVNESRIKSILTVMATGQRMPPEMLRRLVRPLYPPGTSLDSKLLFNIRLKIKRMLAKGDIDLASHTVTKADEAHLLSNTEDLDYLQSPEFLTEAFLQFRELLEESLGDQNDVQNILHYLDKMVKCDPTFDYRVGRSSDGTVTGFVWQTGVMRRDFELYGDVLFVDCMGKSINTKRWPINTIAMLDVAMDMMKEARKREALCSLCLKPGQRVVKCPKISEAKATLIGPDNLAGFTDGLGDPMFCVVEEPCGSVRETIKEWMQPGRNIPVEAVHLVVRKCFYSATRQDSSRNVVEVFVWGEGGTPVGGHCPAYYPVNKVAQWILTNCNARRRKKHILSSLQKPVQGLSQHLYDYGTSP
ncbi:hypothetical protein IV203_023495 [Nitzschia inconspicua]|uniref:Uncharacterized protein n=1 Tax=Nitzschia inconspicua TaxID=303405 RepID=A0A9K3KDB2_9STRA|nr:hypothetical protein IV203_023495 [Nitzschia inconspicua]